MLPIGKLWGASMRLNITGRFVAFFILTGILSISLVDISRAQERPAQQNDNTARAKVDDKGITINDQYEARVCKGREIEPTLFTGTGDQPGAIFKRTQLITDSLLKHEGDIRKKIAARNDQIKKDNEEREKFNKTIRKEKNGKPVRPPKELEEPIAPRATYEKNLDVTYSAKDIVSVDVPRTKMFDEDQGGRGQGKAHQDVPATGKIVIKALNVTPPDKPVVVTLTITDKATNQKVSVTIEITVAACDEDKKTTAKPPGGPPVKKPEKKEKKRYDPRLVRPNAPVVFQPIEAFSGGFVGLQFVYSRSRTRTEEFLAASDIRTNAFDDSGSGAAGGFNAGYNWVMANRWLIGVMVEANALADRVRHVFAGGTYLGSTMDFSASAQLRAGVLAAPNVLLYAQAGPAVASQKQEINFGGPITEQSKFTGGAVAGVGAEVALPTSAFRSSLFVDYQHSWWNRTGVNAPAASPLFNYSWKRDSDAVSAGFRLRL